MSMAIDEERKHQMVSRLLDMISEYDIENITIQHPLPLRTPPVPDPLEYAVITVSVVKEPT